MGFDECYQLGHVVKTHGLKGELTVFLDVDDPSKYKKLESVFIDLNGKLIPFFIQSFKLQKDHATISLEDVSEIQAAQPLVGKNLYLPLNTLPKLSGGKYYFHQLVGCMLLDGPDEIGLVKELYETPTGSLLGVDHHGTEVLVPIADDIILTVDLDQQKIVAQLPAGLLDVYLNP